MESEVPLQHAGFAIQLPGRPPGAWLHIAALIVALSAVLFGATPADAVQQTPPAKPAQATTEAQQPPQSIDERLLQGLPSTAPPQREADSAESLGGEDLGQSGKPLEKIALRMRVVHERLEGKDVAETTQRLQQAIVADLDRLIHAADQARQSAPRPPQATDPKQPAEPNAPQQSPEGERNRPKEQPSPSSSPDAAESQPGDAPDGRIGEAAPPGAVQQGPDRLRSSAWWGSLPPQMREQLQRTQSDQFLPKYEKLIESYYRRLAEDW